MSLSATSIWIAEGLPFHKQANECYVPLQLQSNVGLLSRSVAEFADKEISELATDSTNAVFTSLICLRKNLKEEDHKDLANSYESSVYRETHLNKIEKKILLNVEREYYLTPPEKKLVEEYFMIRETLIQDIRKIIIAAILMDNSEWKKEAPNTREELKARYGALLRERERFLFSLSIESRASYLTYLKQFTEK